MDIKPFYDDDGTKYERASDWYDPDIVAIIPDDNGVARTRPGVVYPLKRFEPESAGTYAIITFVDDGGYRRCMGVVSALQACLTPLRLPGSGSGVTAQAPTQAPTESLSPEDIWEQIKRACR